MCRVACTVILLAITVGSGAAKQVTSISNCRFGTNGGQRITIHGSGFAARQFTLDDPSLGNKVTFYSNRNYPCDVLKEDSTINQITCYTTPMPEGVYNLEVTVDSVPIPASAITISCSLEVWSWRTPSITSVLQRTMEPGGMVEFEGKIFSDKFGANTALSSNGRSAQIRRLRVGGDNCLLKDGDAFYGLELFTYTDGRISDYGRIRCKMDGSTVGNLNISLLITEFGRTAADLETRHISAGNVIYMIQTYAVIESITATAGSINGGANITITGRNFDQTKSPASIEVGETSCLSTIYHNSTHITCVTPPKPSAPKAKYPGGRGVTTEKWTQTQKSDLGEVHSLDSSASDYERAAQEYMIYKGNTATTNEHVVKLSTFYHVQQDGAHRFAITVAGAAEVYVDPSGTNIDPTTSVVKCYGTCNRYQRQSDEYNFVRGQLIYVVMVCKVYNGSNCGLMVQRSTANLRGDSTGDVNQETQAVIITSNETANIQKLKLLSGFDQTSSTATKVSLSIQNAASGDRFRLRIFGYYSQWISAAGVASDVQGILNKMPMFEGTISVSNAASYTETSPVFDITFNNGIGNIPVEDIVPDTGNSQLSVTVSSVSTGQAGGNVLALQLKEDYLVPPITLPLTAAKLESALSTAIGALCPKDINNQDAAETQDDFEVTQLRSCGGSIDTTVKAFCGRRSLKNPDCIVTQTAGYGPDRKLCFAYKGNMSSNYRIVYRRSDRSNGTVWPVTDLETTESWGYTCVLLSTLVPDDATRVMSVQFHGDSGDTWLDAVMVTEDTQFYDNEPGDVMSQIRSQPMLGAGNAQLIGSVTVKQESDTDGSEAFLITIWPQECGFNIPQIQPYDSAKLQGTSDVFHVGTNTNRQVQCSTTLGANPPVTGSVTLTFMGKTFSVKANATADQIQQSFQDVGEYVSVVHDGNCSEVRWDITFTERLGDLPEMSAASNLQGQGVTLSVQTVVNGATNQEVGGDLASTVNSVTQVTAKINNIPTACASDCSYTFSDAITPVVTGIQPLSGPPGTTLTVAGSGFTSTPTVRTGEVLCTVNSYTDTQILCTVGTGPSEPSVVTVNIDGVGFATKQSSDMFTSTASITSISPVEGSLGGGTDLTITGFGFSTSMAVTVDSNPCTLVGTVHPDQIVCVTPAASTAQSVDVVVTRNSGANIISGQQFTYQQSLTAQLDSFSPSSSSVSGGESFTLTGANFGSSPPTVLVGEMSATIISSTSTSIVAEFPSQGVGNYEVNVKVGNNGYAAVGPNVPTASYSLNVNAISQDKGSVYGGTNITVVGQGFGTEESALDVDFGSTSCEVMEVTDSRFICRMQPRFQTFNLDNTGESSTHGQGFAWNNPDLFVEVGDKIVFSWTGNTRDTLIKVVEIDGQQGNIKNSGWDSGSPVNTGSYSVRMPAAGDYWYRGIATSSSSDSEIVYEGKINALLKPQHTAAMTVSVNNFEATYNPQSGVVVQDDAQGCGKMTSSRSGCNMDPIPTGSADRFSFTFTECYSGEVTEVTFERDTLTLQGSGWSSELCQNYIFVGEHRCNVVTHTTQEIICQIETSSPSEMQASVWHDLSVIVAGRGESILNLREPRYVLQPFVDTIAPNAVSTEGGATMRLGGVGLTDTYVTVDGYQQSVTHQSYTEIQFTAPSGSSGTTKTVEVYTNAGTSVDCEKCQFLYNQNVQVLTIQPTSLDGSQSTTFTISGQGLLSLDSAGMTVKFGSTLCGNVQVASDTEIQCEMQNLPIGQQALEVKSPNYGIVNSNGNAVDGVAILSNLNPIQGSIKGNTSITVTGNGFIEGQTSVTISGTPCDVSMTALTTITCWTRATAIGIQQLEVTVDDVTYQQSLSYEFATSATPVITAVSPSSGPFGTDITITGNGFSTENLGNSVFISDTPCEVKLHSATTIVCTTGPRSNGEFPVAVYRNDQGKADGDFSFTYALTASSITPNSGSSAGGQTVTINGNGFDDSVTVQFGVVQATIAESTEQLIVLQTPPQPDTATANYDVVVVSGSQSVKLTYTYDSSKTPTVTSVSPKYGGTSGGTLITIVGTGFGTVQADVDVSIGGVQCLIQSASDTEVTCMTGQRERSISTNVELRRLSWGSASSTNAQWKYYDMWSAPHSWSNGEGTGGKPVASDFVVIPKGKTLLLDEDTPVLKMLLIDGGQLIFDERDVTLNAEYILITNNGSLIVGTEDEPFQHKATIILHGHTLSTKLPIYGSKALITRNGTLEIHGKPIPRTWTRLASTANTGESQVILQESISASVGDQIVIATTGDRHSQKETEVRVVTAVSADGLTLTLGQSLEYKHLGISITVGSKQLEARAEVGLLTRNVVIRGNEDVTWEEEIEECPDGFDTGEFTTQTCFQGRFGAETGSSQFGGHVMGHTPDALMRLEYVELDFMGQAFQLGRYPIHFHLMGDKTGCYVRGASIHNTFNRAINIHGTHNLLIEHNVAYNVMGGAFFLEDGVETGNDYLYNLLLFVKASSSLLNDDVTPAAFWATNPNNNYEYNAVAGGTHFGWWYRLLDHPEGPSASTKIIPRKVQYGKHNHNTAHSLGWFGIWIFEMSDPRNSSDAPQPAQFNSFTAYNDEKGIEFVNMGAFDVDNFLGVNNQLAGWEAKLLLEDTNDVKYLQRVRNSVIAASVTEIPEQIPGNGIVSGVVLPFKGNTVIENVEFHNFDADHEAAISLTIVQGTCIDKCGGFNYDFSGISKYNSPRMLSFRWVHEGALRDLDGSLSGTAGNVITTENGILPDSCIVAPAEFNTGLVESRICPPGVEFGHMSFNRLQPDILFATNAVFNIRNEPARSEIAPYAFKRVISPQGIVALLVLNEEYTLTFEGAAHLTNISYDASFFSITNNTWVIICHRLTTKPDMFFYYVNMGMHNAWNMSTDKLDPNVNVDGDWYFDESSSELCYLVSGKKNYNRPVTTKGNTVQTKINAFKCELVGCVPTDPNTTPRKCSSENAIPYSNIDWGSIDEDNCLTWDSDTSTCKQPGPDDSWIIPEDKWIVLDESPPPLDQLIIYGSLEVQEDAENIRLAANYIYNFMGQLIVGCGEDSRFTGTFTLSLRGNHSTPEFQNPAGQRTPNIGAKALAGIGGVMMHGIEIPKPWTTLAATAEPGATSLILSEHVSWGVGGEIVVTPTGYDPAKYEYGVIQAINRYIDTSGNERTELTLQQPLKYRHIYYHEDLPNGKGYTLAADVGYLTRNIKVEGEAYTGQESEEFGGRVLIAGGQNANGDLYNGFGMFSFVQFTRMGQFGYTSPYDPRDAIAYKDTGDANIEGRYSYVRGCSFRHSYSSTLSVRGADNLHLQWNVISESVGPGIYSDAKHTVVRNNLVNGFKFPGSFNGRYEAANTLVPAAMTLFGSSAELNDNAIAGSERACWTGLPEMQEKDGPNWTNNECYSSLFGIVVMPKSISPWPSQPVQIANFAVYRIAIYAVYMNVPMSLKYSNLILVDNKLSLSTFLFGPNALNHEYDYDKYVTTENCTFVGQSPIFDSASDIPNTAAPSYRISAEGTAQVILSAPVGYYFAAATTEDNNAPLKPIINTMSYNTISLQQSMADCLFAHWNDESFAITSPPNADDYLPPLITRNIHLEDVGANNVFWRRSSSLGKINPSDCVDMECDAHKNSFIKDKDGTLTRRNEPSEIFPIDTHWNGDERYGKGDYRIPSTLLTYPNGSKIRPDTIYDHSGIARTGSCVANNELRYWNCTTNDHEVVMLESMDSDTETRRLSPVALLACPDNICFINLVNGPQDHGWCSGYTCKLRLSLFPLLVAKGIMNVIHFTSISPQAVRFHLPMAPLDVKVLVSLYCSSTNKLEVLLNNELVRPKNSELDADGNVVLLPPTQNGNMDFTPSLADPCGTNFLNGQNMEIVLCGKQIVDLVTKPSVMIGLTVMSIDDFFGKNVQANLAAFLGISQSQIRIVNIESDTSSRKKRSTGTTTYYLEISDTSCSNANCEGGTSTGMTYADLEVLTSAILNGFQTGALSSSLNISINGMTITEALPPVEDPHWQAFVESPVTNRAVQVIDAFTFHSTIVTGTEGNVFTQQPKVHFNDINGAHVANLGVAAIPWQVQAVLRAGSGSNILATLAGNTTVNFINGWANFTDLSLSHSGTGFIIDFNIIFPESNYTLESEPLAVALRSFKVDLAYSAGNVYTSRAHELRFKIVDTITNNKVDNLVWNGAVWSAVLSASPTSGYGGSFTGTTSASFNLGTSEVAFNDLVFDSPGTQVLIITVTSTTGYSLTMQKEVVIMASEMQSMVPDVSQSLSVKYDVDFDTYGNLDFAAGVFLNPMMARNPHIQFSGLTVTQGSVIISVTVAGNTSTVTSVLDGVCSNISSGATFTYNGATFALSSTMTVDGQQYYGVNCEAEDKETDDSDDTKVTLIVALVIAILAILIMIGIFIFWKLKIIPKTKTHKLTTKEDEIRYMGTRSPIEDILWREQSFMSIREKGLPDRPMPGMSTQLGGRTTPMY